ncbi:MAG: hypothetical protein Q9169_006695 [Polycauliona sp. 2 TL-2023]
MLFSSQTLSVTVLAVATVRAWPLSQLIERQELTLELCGNQEAVPDPKCWEIANIPRYLNDPSTGWIQTTPTCADSTRCCIPEDDGWSTCFLRLALPGVGQDCTTLNDRPCTDQTVLAPLDASIVPQVRNTVLSIYGVHNFFSTYYNSLNDAYAQAVSIITAITVNFSPNKQPTVSIFAMLSALTVGLAFLTAPTVATSFIQLSISNAAKTQLQSVAISLQQAPGVARAMWPSGDDLARSIQIGALSDLAKNVTVEMGNTLSRGLKLLMTDIPTFVTFADQGRYINVPPIDPNAIKNDLALTLQTYLVSESMGQNGYYAVPMAVMTKEEFDAIGDAAPSCTLRGCRQPDRTKSQTYWSPESGRQYRLEKTGETAYITQAMNSIKENNWAYLPLLFDGAYNCTAHAQVDDPQVVHVNFDGTLDLGCISKLPMKLYCGTECPTTERKEDGSCPFEYTENCEARDRKAKAGPRQRMGMNG